MALSAIKRRGWLRKVDFESHAFLILWGALVGFFTGLVTVGYRLAVLWGNHALWGKSDIAVEWLEIALRFMVPPAGGLLVGALLYGVLRYRPGHGMPSIIHAVQTNHIYLPWRIALPSMASVLVLSTGGSAGPEGPAAEIGSIFGSNVGRWLGLSRRTIRTLVGAGVAAAIGAVFSAPIAGVFFAQEVIFQGFELPTFAPVMIASVVASIISELVFHGETAISFPQFTFSHAQIVSYLGLGVAIGFISSLFIQWMEFCTNFAQKLSLPIWLKPALGGVGVGLLGIFLPQVVGEGYEFLNEVFARHLSVTLLVLLLIGKFLATGLTLGFGSPGGSFAPALFIGGVMGGLYGEALHVFFPHLVEHPASYGLIGVAGMIAGTFNAPLTSIMIALRVAQGNLAVLLPLMSALATVTVVMAYRGHVSAYTLVLRKHGKWFPMGSGKDPLLQNTVADVLAEPTVLNESDTVYDVLGKISDSEEKVFAVMDSQDYFCGVVTLNELKLGLTDPVMGKLITIGDVVAVKLPRLSPETNLREAVNCFAQARAEALPVFAADGKFVGLVTRDSVLSAYREGSSDGP